MLYMEKIKSRMILALYVQTIIGQIYMRQLYKIRDEEIRKE
jgi:hypothetical protein